MLLAMIGNQFIKRLIVAVGTSLLNNLIDLITGRRVKGLDIIVGLVTAVVVTTVVCMGPRQIKTIKGNASIQKGIINHISTYLNKKCSLVVSFFKNAFTVRFTISYAKTMMKNLFKTLFGIA